jgi:hypothetical protein
MVLREVEHDRSRFEEDEIAFLVANETRRTLYGSPTSSSAQRTRVSRASPLPRSGERSKAVIVGVIERLQLI